MVKQELHRQCCAYVSSRIDETSLAIADAQQTIARETKSSAGDKYETTREMMQQEINRDSGRLYELKKLEAVLNVTDPTSTHTTVQPGSVVKTDGGNFYLGISAGLLTLGAEQYQAISPATPIGQRMMGLKKGDSFEFNKKQYTVLEVH